MTFVVGEDCIKCKHTDCVEVCPVDCFYEGPNFLVIHPDECIDCALCEPECPVDAIFSEDELPGDQEAFLQLNAELAEIWPNITERKEPAPDAEDWAGSPASWSYWSVSVSTDWAAARSGSLAARRGVSRSEASLNPHRCCPCGRSPARLRLARPPPRAVRRYGHMR
ncbi:MAG: hypothetical protein CM15mP84_02330 [Cellvibrionales bacterium]|nr:MAG: hypothetical protein CM15mP84_02330 [Cellvibrionales bacterium]